MSFQSYKEKDKTVCVGKCCVNIQSLFTRLRPNASTGLKQFMELVLAFFEKKKQKKTKQTKKKSRIDTLDF